MKKKKKFIYLLAAFVCCSPCPTLANDLSFSVDYLYWYALQSSMAYAVTVDDVPAFTNPTVIPQKQNWTSGVRLNVGYDLPCAFDTGFSWTHLDNNIEGSTSKAIIVATDLLSPTSNFAVGGNGVGGPASSRWNLNLNLFDVNFGYRGFENDWYSIHPFVALRGGTIHQNQIIHYDNFLDTNTSGFLNATVNQRNNIWLIGPKMGFNSAFMLGRGISLIGEFSASLLYGTLRSSSHTISLEPNEFDVDSTVRNTKNRIVPNLQTFIGLNWNYCLCERYPGFVKVGYEVQYFFHTWRVINSGIQTFYITNGGFGDLMLNGLTISLGLGF